MIAIVPGKREGTTLNMPLVLHGLRVEAIAVHEIRRGGPGAGTSALLTDQLSALSEDLRTFFQDRIIAVASSMESFAAEFVTPPIPPIHDLVVDLLRTGNRDLLDFSRETARHLATAQTGASSSGLLVVASVTHTNAPAVVFLKVENDQGVRIQRREVDGQRFLELEHVRDLILSSRTRLYKQAFIQDSESGFVLEVADRQRGYGSRTAVARFFLERFLGARTRVDSRAATKLLVEAVESVIETIGDPKRQTAIRLDLASELSSRSNMINPTQFAQAHLEDEEISVFEAEVRDRGVPAYFEKDTGLVEAVMTNLRLVGESGIAISGPTSEWHRRVNIGEPVGGTDEVTVEVRDRFHVKKQ